MLNRYPARFLCVACACVMLTSCGSKAGGTGEFATVVASANATTSGLDSDVATWVDATTRAKASPCIQTSIPTVVPDDVSFNVTSAAYTVPNTGSTSTVVPSDLIITRVTLTFTPADSLTPALPAIYQTQFPSAGERIVVGSTSIPVRIATDDLKIFLQNTLACTGLTYSYRLNVSFEALEVNTNRSGTISVPGYFLVRFTDFIDK
jgi:hypothetical protein